MIQYQCKRCIKRKKKFLKIFLKFCHNFVIRIVTDNRRAGKVGSSMRNYEAETLMGKIISRDPDSADALQKLYTEYKQQVYLLSLSIVKNHSTAEDIMQDVFVSAYENCDKFYGGSVKAWLMTIARNLSLNYIKRRRFETPEEELPETPDTKDISEAVIGELTYLDLISILSETEQNVVTLSVSSGLKHYEIAKILGMSYANVRSVYSRALKKLKKLLSEGGGRA